MNNEIINFAGLFGLVQKPPVSFAELLENNWVAKNMYPSKEAWESLGFVFLDNPSNNYVYDVKCPEGWIMRKKEYAEIIEIIDEKGRLRGSLIPHMQGPFMCLRNRYEVCSTYYKDEGIEEVYFGNATEKLYVAGTIQERPGMSEEESQALYEKLSLLRAMAEKYAQDNFPDWKNPLLYWDYNRDISQSRV